MMLKPILLMSLLSSALTLSFAAVADNSQMVNPLPACDAISIRNNIPCTTDTRSIKVPSAIPDANSGIITPPEIPAEGLPNRQLTPNPDIIDQQIINDSVPKNNQNSR